MSTEPGYAFRGPGLDRAELWREDPAKQQAHWPAARVVVVDAEGHARFPGSAEAPEFVIGASLFAELPEDASFPGLDGDTAWFALPHESLPEPLPGRLDLRQAALQWPMLEAAALAQARALLHWQQRNRHCGACGHALARTRGGWCARCAQCGLEHYPRTDPAVIVAVTDGSRLLLGRQAGWPAKRWSVLAGFVEPGESLEQTVAREVMEEAGVPVLESRYAASQPWPFPMALMVGFHATALPVEPVVSDELEQARWFSLAEIEAEVASGELLLSPRLSIARWLIDDWMARARG
ncbi:NAD(+) diphosphatase [Arenimonas daejeonensis]|uniref:NAD(+) diphosphatase n=1 Tax=Arenimonas daejeonensis TaxID=370777 RepID=UPI0011BE569F|nr:NAD(+) diphosphatase [Arenimonas daejeonensis]